MVIQLDLTLLGDSPAKHEGQSELDEDKTRLEPLLLLLPLGLLGRVGVLESINPCMHWCDKPWGLLSVEWIAGSLSAWSGF